jgi:hypothetical protein
MTYLLALPALHDSKRQAVMSAGPAVPVLCAAVKPAHEEQIPHGGGHVGGRPDAEQLLTVRSSDHDDAIILTVCGDVDGLTAPRLRMAIEEAFDRLSGRPL